MNRALRVWCPFALCLVTGLGALAWISHTALRMEAAEQTLRREAALEEKARLALWRMDSSLNALLARENARPGFQYTALYAPADPYATQTTGPGDRVVSPLLAARPRHVLVHFQVDLQGRWSSPQLPPPEAAAAPWTPEIPARLQELKTVLDPEALQARLSRLDTPSPLPRGVPIPQTDTLPQEQSQTLMNIQEFQARQQALPPPQPPPASTGREGLLAPLWLGDRLLLVRRAEVGKHTRLQGCWLDWPALKQELEASIQDLLQGARVVPAPEGPGDPGRQLAALPVRLDLQRVSPATEPPPGSPLRAALGLAWGCAALAGLSAAWVLHRTLQLSQRRGAFVSAVTHELRTPLTTFRLYTELLAFDMVPDEERPSFLTTLRIEADRLDHLVKNVLAYARLESRRHPAPRTAISLGDLVAANQERLWDRTRQAGLDLEIRIADPDTRLVTDPSAVEQILFNLVDNACKYAANGRQVRLDARSHNSHALLEVSDQGPGLSREQRRHLFQPFRKSATEAAHSAPGIGLGLALCRDLARALGGDLSWMPSEQGACFRLALPKA